MRKPQAQPALANLTEADREQLAAWLRHATYDVVRERIAQPRPHGFGLAVSNKPLQTFYAKVALLDLLNARHSGPCGEHDDKKLTLAQFENLSSTTFNLEPSTCNPIAAAHDSILEATHDLATSGDNTPAQLLALQRLADFPDRANLRSQRHELAVQKHAQKLATDAHRQHIATEKLEIQKRRLHLAEKSEPSQKQEDELGPFARNWDDISERARIQFGATKEEWAARLALNDSPAPHPSASSASSAVNPSENIQ